MNHSLFLRLKQGRRYRFRDTTFVPPRTLCHSIERLLNTRMGSAAFNGDYGMPDLYEACHQDNEGAQWIASQIQQRIAHFEPRLQQVTIQAQNTSQPQAAAGIHMALLADCDQGGRLHFQVHLGNDGVFRVWYGEQ